MMFWLDRRPFLWGLFAQLTGIESHLAYESNSTCPTPTLNTLQPQMNVSNNTTSPKSISVLNVLGVGMGFRRVKDRQRRGEEEARMIGLEWGRGDRQGPRGSRGESPLPFAHIWHDSVTEKAELELELASLARAFGALACLWGALNVSAAANVGLGRWDRELALSPSWKVGNEMQLRFGFSANWTLHHQTMMWFVLFTLLVHTAPEAEAGLIWVTSRNSTGIWNFDVNATRNYKN